MPTKSTREDVKGFVDNCTEITWAEEEVGK